MRKPGLMRGMSVKSFILITAIAVAALIPYGCKKKETGREHFVKGLQYMSKKQHDDAIREFQETLKYSPNSPETYNNLGFEYMDKGDLDKAIECQNKAIQLNPKLGFAYYGLAMALDKKGDKEGALKNWKEFLNYAQPHTSWWMNAQARIKALEEEKKK